ncbi:MAG: PqqD family peptide modification chaperone [Acidobacteria bacterium]|nr:PqqD family peptide modification chaperone [Acidobacteriota bacterium]
MDPASTCTALPRLRPDLLVLPDGETGTGKVIKDPRTRRYFRFDELEGFILERLDGERTPVDIQVELATWKGEEFALDEIQEFLDTLRDKGLVEGGPMLPARAPEAGQEIVAALEQSGLAGNRVPPGALVPRVPGELEKFQEAIQLLREGRFQAALRALDELLAANPGHREAAGIRAVLVRAGTEAALHAATASAAPRRGSLLYYRVPLCDPDRLLARLEPSLRFVWTPAFAGLYALFALAAGVIAATHGRELFTGLPELGGAGWIGSFLVLGVLLTSLHEMSHGLTCKHYGGRVPEMGFLLIFLLMPALYADVSDAWLMRRRAHRVLVGLAGPLFDFAVACAGLVLWAIVPPGAGRALAILLLTVGGTSVLLNLNPLIRLDGYYILSDLAGVPNLRATATRAYGRALRRLRGQPVDGPALPVRTRNLLVVYAVLSTAYMLFLLLLLARLLVGFSLDMAGLWGPVLMALAGLVLARRPLAALAASLVARARSVRVGGLARAAVVLGGLAAVALMPWPLKVTGPASLDSSARSAVRPEVPGKLAELLVAQGAAVTPGQLVARLDTSELDAALSMTASEIARANADLDLLLRGPEREQVRQAHEQVAAAEAEVQHLRGRHDRLTRLRRDGLVELDLYEEVGKELRVREGALRAAVDQARLVARGARPETIAAARAEVARLESKRADLTRRAAACELRAASAGQVITPDLERRLGEWIAAGATVLEIADTTKLFVEVEVLESEIGDVRTGQRVALRFSAFPDRSFAGQVREVAPVAVLDKLGRGVFRVRCSVEDRPGLLRPGMTGAAKIACGRIPLARVVARRVLRWIDPALL